MEVLYAWITCLKKIIIIILLSFSQFYLHFDSRNKMKNTAYHYVILIFLVGNLYTEGNKIPPTIKTMSEEGRGGSGWAKQLPRFKCVSLGGKLWIFWLKTIKDKKVKFGGNKCPIGWLKAPPKER